MRRRGNSFERKERGRLNGMVREHAERAEKMRLESFLQLDGRCRLSRYKVKRGDS